MNRFMTLMLLCGLTLITAAATGQTPAPAKQAAGAKPIRVLLTYGGHDFQEKEFFAMWDSFKGITYDKAKLPDQAGLLKPGLKKKYDVLVRYDMVKALTPEQEKAFVELLKTGIGFVALHHSICAQQEWPEYIKIVGGKYFEKAGYVGSTDYRPSTYAHDQDLKVSVADREHEITKGIADFTTHDEAYGGVYVSPKVHVLLTTEHPKSTRQIAWVTAYGKSPIFCLMLGHDAVAYNNPAFRELLARGVRWAAKNAKTE